MYDELVSRAEGLKRKYVSDAPVLYEDVAHDDPA
jgi:hypothetical protein